MIKIICVGKVKESYYRDAIEEYLKRLSKYTKVEIIEVNDLNYDKEKTIREESKLIIDKLNNNDYKILMDINGEILDSVSLSKKLNDLMISNSNITFIIGGSNGLEDEIINKCNETISFSDFTFPHGLFRGILLEQIYRSFKINNNETYHK